MKKQTARICALQCVIIMLMFGLQGCVWNNNKIPTTPDSFSDGWKSHYDEMLVYKTLANEKWNIKVLNYETMEKSSLCNKPNCTHNQLDCIVQRLDGNIPVFGAGKAYYFTNDPPQIKENENGVRILQLGATLYSYDLTTNQEEKLCHVDGGFVSSQNGWLLHDGNIYYISNEFSRSYDDNGNVTGYATVGGTMRLCAVNLSNMKATDYGELYDISDLTTYYPDAPYSAECYMHGIFNNKIYFTVDLRESFDTDTMIPQFLNYVTSFDLETQTYSGEPKDYTNIERGRVRFLSKDFLAIASKNNISVYATGNKEPIVFTDDSFNEFTELSVFDNLLFCQGGMVYNLNTKEGREVANLKEKQVLDKFGESYIISESGYPDENEKKTSEQLLS